VFILSTSRFLTECDTRATRFIRQGCCVDWVSVYRTSRNRLCVDEAGVWLRTPKWWFVVLGRELN